MQVLGSKENNDEVENGLSMVPVKTILAQNSS